MSNKWADKPLYRDVKTNAISITTLGNGTIPKIISDEYNGTKVPVQNVINNLQYIDVYVLYY